MVAHLGPARETGFHLQAANVKGNLFTKFADKYSTFRTGSHHAHVALQHTENLRQLVNAGLAQELANLGNTRVILSSPLSTKLFSVGTHGAELVDRKGFAIKANAFLGIENRAMVIKFNRKCRQQADRQRTKPNKAANNNIKETLNLHLPRGHSKGKEFLQFETMDQVSLEPSIDRRIKFRNNVDMQGQFAHPDQHAHDFLRRSAIMGNNNSRNPQFLDQGRQVRILTQDGNATEQVIHHLVAFIHKAHNPLTNLGSVLQGLHDVLARFGTAQHQHLVRPITTTEQSPESKIQDHAERRHEHQNKNTIDKNPGEPGTVDIVAIQGNPRSHLAHELRTEKSDDNQDNTHKDRPKHPQNLQSSGLKEPCAIKASKGKPGKPANIEDAADMPIGIQGLGRVELFGNPAAMELNPVRQDKADCQGEKVRKEQEHPFQCGCTNHTGLIYKMVRPETNF